MLHKRLISSAIIISIAVSLMVLDFYIGMDSWFSRPGCVLTLLSAIIGMLLSFEMLELFKATGFDPPRYTIAFGNFFVILFSSAPILWKDYPADCSIGRLGWMAFAIAGAFGAVCIVEMRKFKDPGRSTVNIALGALAICYVGLLGSFIVALRLFGSNAWGMTAVISMIAIAKISDAGAYATGKLIGRTKFSPVLSPKKTVEGAIGALVFGVLGAALMFYVIIPFIIVGEPVKNPFWAIAVYGLVVTLAGMVGDLVESLFKRDAQIKDSSKWLPGLGGLLDIFDSLLVAAPAAFACWAGGLVG